MRYFYHESRKAIWSQRLALMCLLLFLITVAMHRFDSLSTLVAVQLLGIAAIGALVAVLLGVMALVGIWREGDLGTGRALFGTVLSLGLLALSAAPDLLMQPRISDVTSDPQQPPALQTLAGPRHDKATDAPAHQRGAAETQRTAYPDMGQVTVGRRSDETSGAVRRHKTIPFHNEVAGRKAEQDRTSATPSPAKPGTEAFSGYLSKLKTSVEPSSLPNSDQTESAPEGSTPNDLDGDQHREQEQDVFDSFLKELRKSE